MTAIGAPTGLVLPNVVTFSHVWTIMNFSLLLQKPGEELVEPSFSAGPYNHKWHLSLYPRGGDNSSKDYVNLYFNADSPKHVEVEAKVQLSIVNAKNQKSNSFNYQFTFDPPTGRGYSQFVQRNYLLDESNELLPNDTLTILCEFSVIDKAVNTTSLSDSAEVINMTAIGVPTGLVLPQVDATVSSWSYTRPNVATFSHVWTIVNFSLLLHKTGEELVEPSFSAGPYNHKWHLSLYPRGADNSSKDYVTLYFNADSPKHIKVEAKVQVSIVNAKNQKSNSIHYQHTFNPPIGHGWPQYVKRNYLLNESNELLPNDTLTILCEFSVIDIAVNTTSVSDSTEVITSRRQLPEELGLLYDSGKFSDLTLVAQAQEFRVHRAILAARSSVFAKMLENGIAERTQNRLEINDVDVETMREMLRFVYTDTVKNLLSLADDLLIVADKYDLVGLKTMCEHSLLTNVTVEDAADALILADTFNATWLRAKVKNYIINRARVVMATAGFGSMISSHPELASEAIRDSLVLFQIGNDTSKLPP